MERSTVQSCLAAPFNYMILFIVFCLALGVEGPSFRSTKSADSGGRPRRRSKKPRLAGQLPREGGTGTLCESWLLPIQYVVRDCLMFRKTLFVLIVAMIGTALVSTGASARGGFGGGGFGGGGFHGGFAGGGWRGGGWGGGWRGAGWGWRGRGWGWGPAVAVGVGLGVAGAAWGPWGWGDPGWGYAGWDGGCTRWRQVWTGWGWRPVPVNVCW
jgi:hypothetical protein